MILAVAAAAAVLAVPASSASVDIRCKKGLAVVSVRTTGDVKQVIFKVNGKRKARDRTAPYSAKLAVRGKYRLVTADVRFSDGRNITLNNKAPNCALYP